MNVVTNYIAQTVERATRSGAAVALTALTGASMNLFGWNWETIVGAFGAGFVIELLLSISAQPVGDKFTPSFLPAQGTTTAHLP